MFGEEYKIVREFPEYFLDYREILDPSIRWTDRVQSSSGDWTGNLFEFYFRVYNKITKDLKVPFKIQGGDRIDDTPVHKAIREALANCLINADYYGRYGVVIKKETEILIFENPGDVRTGKKQMLRGGMSDPRNKALMKMFNMINVGERAGSGVPDIYAVWENEGWKEPIVEEKYNPDRTILTLSFEKKENRDKKAAIKSGDKKAAIKSGDKKVTNKTQQQYVLILNYMEKDREYGIQDFCILLQLKESRTKDILKGLVDNGIIETVGAKKDRRYRLK
jgi:predicted HTH transcriptional regulator